MTEPRPILITGASTGIGYACARRFDALGLRVFAGVRSEADAERLQGEGSPRLVPVLMDVIDAGQIRRAAESISETIGPAGLAGLVNNAGIVVPGPLELLTSDDFRRQLEVNVVGTHAVTRAFLPLVRQARGRIVLVGSFTGRVSPPFMGAYAATKFALEAMADAWRVELRRDAVGVSIVEPDSVATPIWDKMLAGIERLLEASTPEARRAYEADFNAIRRATWTMQRQGMPVERVVAAIEHALTARRPRTRYPVGFRTRLAFWAFARIGDRARDWFVRRSMGLE